MYHSPIPEQMPRTAPNTILTVALHTIGWGILFGLPFIFTARDGSTISLNRYLGFVAVPLAFMTVFYLNYFVLIGKFLFRRKWMLFVAANAVLIVLISLTIHLWHEFYFAHISETPPHKGPHPSPWIFVLRDGVMMALTAALCVAIRMTGNWYRTENEKAELARERTEAELRNLKSQLNPHFLFNTLNNIYSLIASDRDRAQYAVHSLSRLLRYVLYDNNENTVPLERELAFIRSYVELMQLRLSQNVDVKVSFPDRPEGLGIAPLLFISLIENAFKHGVSADAPSFVHIRMEMPEERILVCTIENSYFPKTDDDRSGSGIGLSNLQRRLNLLYPQGHILRAQRMGETYFTQLIVNL